MRVPPGSEGDMMRVPPREGPEPRVTAYRGTSAFAAGMFFASMLVLYAGGDVVPRSRRERERLAEYLRKAADAEWRR